MPATAGRVRMPANNRVHSSAALQTHGIWQSAIGYDPYAPNKDDSNPSEQKTSNSEKGAENAYASFQGLLALARITGSNADEVRGACKKCFRVGHLTYQCRNFLSVKENGRDKDLDEINTTLLAGIDRLKGNMLTSNGGESSEGSSEEDESESSDSDVDSEMERIIAERSGRKISSRRHFVRSVASDDDNCDSKKKKKRERSRTRRNRNRKERDLSDERVEEIIEKRRRRRRDVSSSDNGDEDDEGRHGHARKSRKDKRRRRSHRRSDDSSVGKDSGRHGKRKSRGQDLSLPDSSEGCSSDDSRVGRSKKRSLKKSHRRHHRYED